MVTVGRRLDFQLAYGSPAVFGTARFVRIADAPSELRDNRRGAVEMLASPAAALDAIVRAAGEREPAVDRSWATALRTQHEQRSVKLRKSMAAAAPGRDGRMHPNRLLAALQDKLPANATVIADGGDFLSFARVGLRAGTYLDPGVPGLSRDWRPVRDCGKPGAARSVRRRGHWRWLVRIQCHRGGHGGAASRAAAHRGGQQRRVADRGLRPSHDVRPRRRHAAAARGLRRDGACVRNARRESRNTRRICPPRSIARSRTGRRCSTCW